MKPEQLLKISALAGKILLENGAEIQRTEDTICRICHFEVFDIGANIGKTIVCQ